MKRLGGIFKITCSMYLVLMSSSFTDAYGQWVEQTISLEPGWNSVYLEVQPEPRECDVVFQNIPVASVWCWNPKSSSAQYISTPPSPESLQVGHPLWLAYFPPSQPEHIATSLFNLIGGKAYLIKLNGIQQVQWTIKGKPRLPGIDWETETYFLSGYHLTDDITAPTFGDFFSASTGHTGRPVYRLVDTGSNWEWQSVDANDPMKRAEAYWTSSQWSSDFTGPLAVEVEQSGGLVYDKILVEQTLTIRNLSDSNTTVDITLSSSLSPPVGTYEAVAGDVPLLYWAEPPESNSPWQQLPPTLSIDVNSLSEKSLRLAVKRSDMPGEGLYQSILEIDNNQGMTVRVPVSAEYTDLTGLWVGYAAIDNVSQPADYNDPILPKPTASEFQFPLILHVDPNGNVYLLREIVQLWKNGVTDTDPITGMDFVKEPGRFVLVTDESLFSDPNYGGASLRDGQPRGRRISSAAFSFPLPVKMQPVPMSEPFGFEGAVFELESQIVIDSNDPLNPFRHKFHPDHDDLSESYKVTRNITLEFTSNVPGASLMAGWGDTDIGGVYREVLTGLHKQEIHVKGTFRLHRISQIGQLNDGR
jgi:hypothetical protein